MGKVALGEVSKLDFARPADSQNPAAVPPSANELRPSGRRPAHLKCSYPVVCERCGRAGTYRRDGLVARFIILCLCGTLLVGQAAPAKDEETLQGKLAEMVAFIRSAEPCDACRSRPNM
jgi:hypothetical protein